jgi:hypothetical protein
MMNLRLPQVAPVPPVEVQTDMVCPSADVAIIATQSDATPTKPQAETTETIMETAQTEMELFKQCASCTKPRFCN